MKLEEPLRRHDLREELFCGDRASLVLQAAVTVNGEPCTIDSAAGYAVRSDGVTILCAATVEGHVVTCALPEEAGAVPGPVTVLLRACCGDALITILAADLMVVRGATDTVTDPGRLLMSLEEVISHIDDMKQATAHAKEVSAQVDGKAAAVLLTTDAGASCSCRPEAGSPLQPVLQTEAEQAGSGTPSPQNIRAFAAREQVTVTVNGTPVTAALPEACWGGTVSWPDRSLTHTFGRYVLTGNESGNQSVNGFIYLYTTLEDAVSDGRGRCSHYTYQLWGSIGIANGSVVFFSPGETLDTWRAYLREQYAAGTPVTLLYELKEPVTVPAALPEIRAAEGVNMLTHDGGGSIAVRYQADLRTLLQTMNDRLTALEAG